jgi:hypothetical protein
MKFTLNYIVWLTENWLTDYTESSLSPHQDLQFLFQTIFLSMKRILYGRYVETTQDETRRGHWEFSIYLILSAALHPVDYSASNRNKYLKEKICFWGVERSRCIRLATSQPSLSRLSRKCGVLSNIEHRPWKPIRLETSRIPNFLDNRLTDSDVSLINVCQGQRDKQIANAASGKYVSSAEA